MISVIGGRLKNRQIKTPKGDRTRPTSALVRKAVFDICQQEIEGARFLDLCAGSGAMGIEALSRGAATATFVDEDRFAIQCIHQNLEELELSVQSQVLRLDVGKAVKMLEKKGVKFELIYVDPPYAMQVMPLLEALDKSELLAPGGRLLLEQRVSSSLALDSLHHLKLQSERKFGDTLLLIFLKETVDKPGL